MTGLLLCTDLDRTLIPNGPQPESPGARALFSRLMQHGFSLAYVSGRHRALIEEAIDEYDLPTPDFVIADVGSTIYRIVEGTWQQWPDWDEEIGGDWKGLSAQQLHEVVRGIPLLELQEQEKQNRHKLSYYLPTGEAQSAIVAEVDKRLQERNIQANLIVSADDLKGVGLLDILPASANKLHAINFLMQESGFDLSSTLFAGDSGNDLDVFLSPINSVLVANSSDEIRRELLDAEMDSIYMARGDFLNMNGCYSAGILEGIAHYHPELLPLMEQLK